MCVKGGEGEEGVFEREENRSGKIKEKERRRIKRRGRELEEETDKIRMRG